MGTRPLPMPSVPTVYHHPNALEVIEPLDPRFPRELRDAPPPCQQEFFLWACDDRLELRRRGERRGFWIPATELVRRDQRGSELLRACGADGRPLRVLDAMAGWGVDGLLLARRGCQVTLVERQPLMVALQQDLRRRTAQAGARCRWDDGYAALGGVDRYDVIYLDPMFPARRKSALPGKRLQWLAALAEPDPRPLEQWLAAARACATVRVVLKRRRTDAALGPVDWQIRGRSVRYDVYRPL